MGFLAFLAGPIGRWLVIGLIVAASLTGLYHNIKQRGWDEREAVAIEEDKERARQVQLAIERQIASRGVLEGA
ncbi:MAG: hypothetical protein IPM64_17420 [Phycisphaerales bacterium]|nr:hypothetical protein [Phycisphaerales bacterium]